MIWLITIGWSDTSFVDFLVRCENNKSYTKLDIYRWFFSHINDKILQFDYSSLDNIEGDLDLSQLFNLTIEHENLNIFEYKNFLDLSLTEIEQFMRENGENHGMMVTVEQALVQNYEIINVEESCINTVWKITYHPRLLICAQLNDKNNLYDIQLLRPNYLWQIRAVSEKQVYRYLFNHLEQFHLEKLPKLMGKNQHELLEMIESPDYQLQSEMINTQCCNIKSEHIHDKSTQDERFAILIEPALNLLDIIDM
ncbi:unnamed protein product [Didymodactylos carnosus]|uniref:Uncharacterized protein n=1 Tax=Didymodactylos carnosus TaxID=1234261 RepID=A0A814GAB3_9BILA|nr:unnamed protein product [Didymodactylos carnosus]CAF1300665.1 unnamed protein product [Didymodactylos carnosus]CAF3765488.1 unnamed protein product [Didymodactylos carnosus]CAF4106895.1 unnamed protein product [Didymodactylos carnosus]